MELKFRKIQKADSELLADWLSGDTWPFFLGHTQSKDDVLKRIGNGDFFGDGELNFWILNPTENPIGFIELYQLDDLAPMFSIRFKSEFRGKGFGRPALDWLKIGGFDFRNVSAVAFDFQGLREYLGKDTPLIIGNNLILQANWIIDLKSNQWAVLR